VGDLPQQVLIECVRRLPDGVLLHKRTDEPTKGGACKGMMR